MQSFNPSKDYELNPSTFRMITLVFLRRVEGQRGPSKDWRIAHAILQPFEGLHLQSLEGMKDHAILGRVEGLRAILQPFEGL